MLGPPTAYPDNSGSRALGELPQERATWVLEIGPKQRCLNVLQA
jgi:hypothetical protein